MDEVFDKVYVKNVYADWGANAVGCGEYLSFWKPSKQNSFYLVSIPKRMGIKASAPNMEAKEASIRLQTASTEVSQF